MKVGDLCLDEVKDHNSADRLNHDACRADHARRLRFLKRCGEAESIVS